MRRGWHLSFVTVVLGLVAVLLAGCPKRPTLAPRAAGPAPGVGPSVSAPPPAPGAAGAVGVPGAPAAPAPVPGPAPGRWGVDPPGTRSSAGVPELSMVVVRTDNLIGTPTLDDPVIVDDRTRHHAPRVRE